MKAAGCIVTWDAINKMAIVEKDGTIVKIPVGSDYITVNGIYKPNDTVAQIKGGRTDLPIRAVLEAFGANVSWNSQRAIVEVNMQVVSMIKNETIKYNDGSFYTGDTKHGIPNAEGTVTYGDGDFYIGNFVNGVFEC